MYKCIEAASQLYAFSVPRGIKKNGELLKGKKDICRWTTREKKRHKSSFVWGRMAKKEEERKSCICHLHCFLSGLITPRLPPPLHSFFLGLRVVYTVYSVCKGV